MRFQNVLFDLYGTLVDIRTDEHSPALWEEMASFYARNGAVYPPEELKKRYFETVSALEAGSPRLRQDAHEAHPEIDLGRVFQKLYRDRGASADPALVLRTGQLFRELSTEYIRPYPGARELLEELRRWGRGVWLLSNAQAMFTRPELQKVGLDGAFDGVYLSSDYGVKKPDTRFFEIPLREGQIHPSAAAMVGNDGACDIRPAKSLGLAAVYLRTGISPDEPRPEADLCLEGPDYGRVLEFLLS